MRKVKLPIQTTSNGYLAGPNGENAWMIFNTDAAKCITYSYAFFRYHFAGQESSGRATLTIGKILLKRIRILRLPVNRCYSKIVFTTTLTESPLEQYHFINRECSGGNCLLTATKW